LPNIPGAAGRIVLADPTDICALYLRDPACGLMERAITDLESQRPALSARRVLTPLQGIVLLMLVAFCAYATYAAPDLLLLGIAVFLSVIFLAGNTINLLACLVPVPQTMRRKPLPDSALPIYTVLVPLYREERVVPQLLAALAALDYPPDKLDIKLLIEADDPSTRARIESLPRHPAISLVVLPDVGPRTKPKALTVGLALAKGSLVTVFDAEDTPEADQLRQAAECFAGNPTVACLQARLSYRNWRESMLSRSLRSNSRAFRCASAVSVMAANPHCTGWNIQPFPCCRAACVRWMGSVQCDGGRGSGDPSCPLWPQDRGDRQHDLRGSAKQVWRPGSPNAPAG
jgi:hypothetical protein